jgi:hypothetical protein
MDAYVKEDMRGGVAEVMSVFLCDTGSKIWINVTGIKKGSLITFPPTFTCVYVWRRSSLSHDLQKTSASLDGVTGDRLKAQTH